VRAHRELLLNHFKAKKQFSSGIIEGLNIKAKVPMRKAYGYWTFRIAELSVSRARQASGTKIDPQIFLTKRNDYALCRHHNSRGCTDATAEGSARHVAGSPSM
jgi:hypothetical protein